MIDGPFTEAKELIAGFAVLGAKSKEEAIEWASRCPAEYGGLLEIRQVFEASDFGPRVARKEAALVEEIGKRVDENRKHTTP